MSNFLISALAIGVVATIGFVGVAQAHHKVGHCIPGIVTVGCPLTPQTPQAPKPGN